MKSILISIRPEWVAKILNGEKTIEIRKTMPKCELPIDVYIYSTKSSDYHLDWAYGKKQKREYFCWDKKAHHYPFDKDDIESQSQKVLAKFTLNKVRKYKVGAYIMYSNSIYNETGVYVGELQDTKMEVMFPGSCLSNEQLEKYIGDNDKFYAWKIDDLQVFDEPKELSEFNQMSCIYDYCSKCRYDSSKCGHDKVYKAPQSWCYVEVEND